MYQGDEDDELQRLLEGRDEDEVRPQKKSPVRKKQRVDDDIIPEREDYGNMDDFIIRHPDDDDDSDDEEQDNNRGTAADEAIEVPVKAKAVRRVTLNPQPKLDPDRLKSAKGLVSLLDEHAKLSLRGPGYESDDLNRIMFSLEHWGHRLFPKITFDDFIEKLEQLGSKKAVSVFVKKMRQGQPLDVPNEFVIDEEDEEDDIQRGFNLMAEPEAPVSAEQAFDSIFSNGTSEAAATGPAKESISLTEEQRQDIARKRLQAIERRKEREIREALDRNESQSEQMPSQASQSGPDVEQESDLISQKEFLDMLADAEME